MITAAVPETPDGTRSGLAAPEEGGPSTRAVGMMIGSIATVTHGWLGTNVEKTIQLKQ